MTVVLEGFAGPGGLSEGMSMVGAGEALGIEMNADACAIARAAGHVREQSDIRDLDPADHPDAEVWGSAPPCPTFTTAGRRSGVAERPQVVKSVESVSDSRPVPTTSFSDVRTGLVLETLRFALDLPALRAVIAEQVPNVGPIWVEMCAELVTFHGFESATVATVAADDYGLPTRRTRAFLIATRDYTPDLSTLPTRARWTADRFGGIREYGPTLPTSFGHRSMADALGWPHGITINTRGDRKTSGGNLFSADGPAQSLTCNGTRSWYRTDLGPVAGRLTPAQAGLLQGFRPTYPWHVGGSRTSQFQRVADSVAPPVAAAVAGAALDLPWRDAVRDHLAELYGGPCSPRQLDLFDGFEGIAS